MVKIREAVPTLEDGSIDIMTWINRIREGRNPEEGEQLVQAVRLSLAHGGATKLFLNETCLEQGLHTAETLLALEPDITTLLATIVYFTAHYAQLDSLAIESVLGKEVSILVNGVIQIASHTSKAKEYGIEVHHDNLRKMLLAVVEDVRVVLIKLAERITALRAAAYSDETLRRQLAIETRDIYAPLANRLGIGQIKWELEDFAFRYLEPQAYKQIAKLLDEKRLDREVYLNSLIEQIEKALAEEKVETQVTGRVKHIYSIWRKMNRKHLDFKDIYDVRAIRILVSQVRDCYAALGIIHSLWPHIPYEFDDYIANPKENGYRSLHTAVLGPQGRTVEIQIRTFQMHQEAELGIAAHWLYKEGGKLDPPHQKKINVLRRILEVAESEQEISEVLLKELLEEQIYVFTPRGDVMELPQGSTPIDFAYRIHTELGHRCRGAKVNSNIVPLNYKLKSGEKIEILSIKEGNPSRDWLNPALGYLRSARARAKVQNWFKRQAKEEEERQKKEVAVSKESVEKMSKVELPSLKDQGSRAAPTHSDITIEGIGNLLCYFARCCKPLPGDKIIGFITLGRGVSVHREDCLHVLEKGKMGRLVPVEWGETDKHVYPIDIHITAHDRQALLKDITTILSSEKVNVIAANTSTHELDKVAHLLLTIEVTNLAALDKLLKKIAQLPNIIEVERLYVRSNTPKL